QTKHLGVTPPIAVTYPTPREIEVTDLLVQELTAQGTFESEEESKRREVVLGKLDKLVKEFVYNISREKKKLPEADAKEAGGKIFTFGSYRLGVHGAGADIDTLCVVPRHVTREDFFDEMHRVLRNLSEVNELTCVPDAYVPVIKLKFQDIPIDLLFARLELPKVPDELELKENTLLKNLDETCIRSLNGSRVTDEILRLVPSIPAFRTSLRCIKLWAKRRAIYSNVMGFFGGVAWAMLVARICQLYPNAIAGAIVSRFFRIMHQWRWPQPVLLKPIEDGPLQVRVWNPKIYHGDRFHLMPIITPAYPSMCATHNVTQSTKKIIEREFERVSSDSSERQLKWLVFFLVNNNIGIKDYIVITRSGMVESRIRHLISKLESVENLELAHPFVKGFDKIHHCTNDQMATDVMHGIFDSTSITDKNNIESSQNSTDAATARVIYTTTFYVGLDISRRDPSTKAPRQLNISWPTQEFIKLVKVWDKYDEKSMGIHIKHVKSSELPPEVFEDGQKRREDSKKRKRVPPEVPEDGQGKREDLKKRKHDGLPEKINESLHDSILAACVDNNNN
ncbi:13040_t:CDS:10, partial [Dentiscutata heterogama]